MNQTGGMSAMNMGMGGGGGAAKQGDYQNVNDVLQHIMQVIGSENPMIFFRQYDAYKNRLFEYWELMSIFQLTNQSVRKLINEIGC